MCEPAETEERLLQQHEEQVRTQTEGVARVSAALKLGKEDAAAVARLREELQKAWAALKASQDKAGQPQALPHHLTLAPFCCSHHLDGITCALQHIAQEVQPTNGNEHG